MNFLSSRAVFVPLWCWCCTAVLSFPLISRQQAVSDVDVLQFALTLEHLENTFYKQALAQFSEVDFIAAGFDASFFVNLQFVAHDEEQHVVFLQQAISQAGATPVAACQYTFPFTDVASFVGLATVLEGVGVSAYLGAASIISSKEILNAAAAITVAEGLHQAVQRASILDVVSANIAGTPLSPNAVFTIAVDSRRFSSSSNCSFDISIRQLRRDFSHQQQQYFQHQPPSTIFVTFISGLSVVSVPGEIVNGNSNGSAAAVAATIPAQAQGQTFALLTRTAVNGSALDDSAVIAGPAIMEVTPSPPTIDFGLL
ncbi:hypothetical protein VTN96DRAFT_618 [Rasamsonia emersonii]